jgi:hypothetical protein
MSFQASDEHLILVILFDTPEVRRLDPRETSRTQRAGQ